MVLILTTIGTIVGLATPYIGLPALGFGAGGIQSNIGNIVAGSAFA